MEEYQIALSPELGMNPADFVAAWNEEAEAHTHDSRLVIVDRDDKKK